MGKPDRREFLGTLISSAGWAGWAALGGCGPNPPPENPQPGSGSSRPPADAAAPPDTPADAGQGETPAGSRPVRRNIATMAANDPILAAFKSAITKMQALPATDPRSWINQANLHRDHCPHGNWLFLPWHRAYLLYFEKICRKLSGMADFALPYWNWTTSPRIPAAYWGDSGNPLFHPGRDARSTSVADVSDVGASVMSSILGDHNFLAFASGKIALSQDQRTAADYGELEGTPHNYIHGFVGGDMGFIDLSPRDPIFWGHHNMIERCWVEWSFDQDNANPNDPDWLNRRFTEFCDENGNPVSLSVADTLVFPAQHYRYDDVGPGPAGTGALVADNATVRAKGVTKARSGAAVRLDVQRAVSEAPVAPVPLTAAIGKPGSVQLSLNPRPTGDNRALIAFNGSTMNHTGDFTVRVFINKPDASPATPADDPHFAGSFAFFHHPMPGHGDTGNFFVDASKALKQLSLDSGTVTVTVVLAPFADRQPATRDLAVASVALRVVKDVVQRSP